MAISSTFLFLFVFWEEGGNISKQDKPVRQFVCKYGLCETHSSRDLRYHDCIFIWFFSYRWCENS